MSLFKGQTVTIRLNTGIDLSSATTTRILYKKPSGTKGYWAATTDSQTLVYEHTIDEEGIWELQSYVVIAGDTFYGDIAKQHFENNISA
jgi:hypothetical protein